jgi:CRP/FNR family transcriptional regulator, cyclic AMP receptor protein
MVQMFDLKAFLTTQGNGREVVRFPKTQPIYSKDDPADSVFVVLKGAVKLTAESSTGGKATFSVVGAGDFIGTCAIADHRSRTCAAIAISDCVLLQIKKKAMLTALREPAMAEKFWKHLLTANLQYQQDLADYGCNNSEKRLALTLIKLAHFEGSGPQAQISNIYQETLAEMIGTTRSRVSFFIKRFRDSFTTYRRVTCCE